MRIAIVSPYSWSYPGGVNRHTEALAEQLISRGHEVRVFAPWDPADRLTRRLHRAEPRLTERPDYLVPLGRTMAFSMNASQSNVSLFPGSAMTLRRELRGFAPDVVHLQEPLGPLACADACSYRDAPVVGTFHAYSTKALPNQLANLGGAWRKLNQLQARIAVSKAAEWTGRRWFGGTYEVIPNGVDTTAPPSGPKPSAEELRVAFVGRPEERKGFPVLLQAFEALVEHVPARLVAIGPDQSHIERYVSDPAALARIEAHDNLPHDERFWRILHEADLLAAPSTSGESFGMVLTEAFAAGTPVVASRISGYSDVVDDGVDGLLVDPGDPQALAEALQDLHHQPHRLDAMATAARESAQRYAWPTVTAQVEGVYERAIASFAALPEPPLMRRLGFMPIDGSAGEPPRRLPALEPAPVVAASRRSLARKAGLALAAVAGVGLTAVAASRIGVDEVVRSAVGSDMTWVVVATALMIASMFLRAASWFWIARSALPRSPLRRRDVTSATMIGVLMSATLPARLGEPARAMVLSRRVGRIRETFPVLLGTLVSQTVFNVLALALLGVIIVSTTSLFHSASERIFLFSLIPLVLLLAVMLAPLVVRQKGSGRLARVVAAIRSALVRVRTGLAVFRDPRRAVPAAAAQLGGWGLQLAACWALFAALGLDHTVGIGAAAAVLFAVNVTAVIPATPSNIGIFQLAVISVLTTGFGVGAADALAYGVFLQAIEIVTAVACGIPALVREGMTWSDVRLRALSAAPVRLEPRPRSAGSAREA